jgi:hypothetical protein
MTIRMRPFLIALPVIIIAWIGLLATIMRLSGQAPAAIVILPPAKFLANLPAGIAVTSRGPFSITLTSTDSNLTAALYAAGAPLVLPAGLTGCLPQS